MKKVRLMSLVGVLALLSIACNTQSESKDAATSETETSALAVNESTPESPETEAPATGNGPGIQFSEASWKAHLAKAKAEKKIIFLDAYTSWCGPCKMLQKNVFTQKEVGDLFNKTFINVKIDMEKGEGPELAMQYPLEGYPTLLFIDGDGNVVRKVLGYQTPEQLLAIGKDVKSGKLL